MRSGNGLERRKSNGAGAMTERLAVWSSRRPWLTLAGWALALVAAIAISCGVPG